MRRLAAFAVGIVAAPICLAQSPGRPTVHLNPQGQAAGAPIASSAVPADPRLDVHLNAWEAKMKTVNGLQAAITRTETDAVEKTVKQYVGEAKFLRPDRATLYLRSATNPQIDERFVFTGTHLYQYRSEAKRLVIHEMANKPGQIVDDNFLNFLFGMKAEDAKRRFDLQVAKEDEYYVYLWVHPRLPSDRQDFTKARLVLFRSNYLPAELQFEEPNGNAVKWDIKAPDPSARLTTRDFDPPAAPKDWQVQRSPRQTAPPAGVTPMQPPSKVRPAGP